MLTDKGCSNNPNSVSVNLDQETVTNINQVKDSNINPDNPSAIHLDDISLVVNKQTDINHNVKNTSNYFSVNITMSNSRVTAQMEMILLMKETLKAFHKMKTHQSLRNSLKAKK